jgi:hypothetical protein
MSLTHEHVLILSRGYDSPGWWRFLVELFAEKQVLITSPSWSIVSRLSQVTDCNLAVLSPLMPPAIHYIKECQNGAYSCRNTSTDTNNTH